MNWLNVLGAVGVGAIAVKLLDVLWLTRIARSNEREKWLREQRLVVFSKLAGEVLSIGLWSGATKSAEALSLSAQAILIANDEDLVRKIEKFFEMTRDAQKKLADMQREATDIRRRITMGDDQKRVNEANAAAESIEMRRKEAMDTEYQKLLENGRILVNALRNAVLAK